jgi:hypothetical protein
MGKYIVKVSAKKTLLLPEFDAFEYASHGYKIKKVSDSMTYEKLKRLGEM